MEQRRLFGFLFTICFIAIWVSTAAAQPTSAAQEVQLGKQALTQGKYDEAIEHFENANNLVPNNPMMQLDLADALAQKYVPGVDNADNERVAEQAIGYYQRVLEGNSRISSQSAEKGIAFLNAQMNKFDVSKDYYSKAKKLNPQDPEPFYLTAVIDWTLTSQFRQQERAKLKLKPEDSLPAKNHAVCIVVKDKNWSNLAEAIDNLNQALELKPIYPDAMTYMNLMYQERADVECDDPAGRVADLKTAGEWAAKALAAQKMRQAKQPAQPAPKQ